MIEFNLEAALAGKPVVTRDGREVSQIYCFKTTSIYPIACIINQSIETFTIDGSSNLGETTDFDLFMKSETRTYWANVYADPDNGLYIGIVHLSEEKVKNSLWKKAKYIKTISFTVEV